MNIPEKYSLGQEFFEDKETLDVEILCTFRSIAAIKEFNLKDSKWEATVGQKENKIIIKIHRKISKKLFSSLNIHPVSNQLIIGYIEDVIPKINENLTYQKYLHGHILINTYSPLDLHEIFVRYENKLCYLSWPRAIVPFPKSKELAEECDEIFIRDYIDAMTCFLSNKNDECIRKIITALENFFIFKKIVGNYKPNKNKFINFLENIIIKINEKYRFNNLEVKRGTFHSKLSECLGKKNYNKNWKEYIPIWEENLKFIYKIRNGIVHKKFRLKDDDTWLCHNAIGTMSYFFQTRLLDVKTSKYIFYLGMYFLMLENNYRGININKMSETFTHEDNMPLIKNSRDMDKAIFSGLKITTKQKETLLKSLMIKI